MKSGFIGNEKDLKNQEVTANIRVIKKSWPQNCMLY